MFVMGLRGVLGPLESLKGDLLVRLVMIWEDFRDLLGDRLIDVLIDFCSRLFYGGRTLILRSIDLSVDLSNSSSILVKEDTI